MPDILPDCAMTVSEIPAKYSAGIRAARFCAIALVATAPLIGCDRQKGDAPQAKQPAMIDDANSVRYRIDRSMAGSHLPTARIDGPSGPGSTLTALAGRPIVLNLWATWCAPCIEELPTLDALAATTGTSAHVIALSQDIGNDAAGPRAFLIDRGWTSIAAWHDPENVVGLTYGGSLPTTILFNARGEETSRVIGPLNWSGPVAAQLLREAGIAAGQP